MSCPSCKMVSPEGAQYCDFCKEPFVKKRPAAKPAAAAPASAPAEPNPLAGIPKEKLLELPAEQFLKADVPPQPTLPPWVRPVAWTFLAFCALSSVVALWLLRQRYEERQQSEPPAGTGIEQPAPEQPAPEPR